MQFRIGDRDPATGLYYVIWPDGSKLLNGMKIFNAAHQVGDVVLATRRSDGMMILDSAKAVDTSPDANLTIESFGDRPIGYLNGQIFNNEDEIKLSVVSVEFAPGSPTELEPGAGDFTVRISIPRAERKNLRVKCELAGTALGGDYSVIGLDGDSIAIILAGQLFFDVVITPNQNSSGADETIIFKLLADRVYRLGENDSVTATTLASAPISLSISFAPSNPGVAIKRGGSFVVRISANQVVEQDLLVFFALGGNANYASEYVTSGSSIATSIPVGSSYVDLVINTITRSTIATPAESYSVNRSTIDIRLVAAYPSYTSYTFSTDIVAMQILPRQFTYRIGKRSISRSGVFPGLTYSATNWQYESVAIDESESDRVNYDLSWANATASTIPYDNLSRFDSRDPKLAPARASSFYSRTFFTGFYSALSPSRTYGQQVPIYMSRRVVDNQSIGDYFYSESLRTNVFNMGSESANFFFLSQMVMAIGTGSNGGPIYSTPAFAQFLNGAPPQYVFNNYQHEMYREYIYV